MDSQIVQFENIFPWRAKQVIAMSKMNMKKILQVLIEEGEIILLWNCYEMNCCYKNA
jgi:hypothetical protein